MADLSVTVEFPKEKMTLLGRQEVELPDDAANEIRKEIVRRNGWETYDDVDLTLKGVSAVSQGQQTLGSLGAGADSPRVEIALDMQEITPKVMELIKDSAEAVADLGSEEVTVAAEEN